MIKNILVVSTITLFTSCALIPSAPTTLKVVGDIKTGADIVGLITNEKTTGDMVASEVLDMDCSTIHFFIRPYKFCKVNEYIKVEEIKEEKPVKVYKFKSAKEVQKYQLSKHKWEYK